MNLPVSALLTIGVTLVLLSCSGTRPTNIGAREGRFAQCPDSPNCVSTFATDSVHRMDPIPYSGTIDDARARLVKVVQGLPRTRILTQDSAYVYAEFTSGFWRFVDDVEFLFDDAAKVINFRSASRLGYSDIGVNRKRMETIALLLRGKTASAAPRR